MDSRSSTGVDPPSSVPLYLDGTQEALSLLGVFIAWSWSDIKAYDKGTCLLTMDFIIIGTEWVLMNRPRRSVDCDVVTPGSLDTQYMG